MSAAFLIVAAVTVAGAVAAMGMRNLVHCILALTVAFAGLALLFLWLGVQFVGLVQVLVYVGAVAILAVFAIMLTQGAGKTALHSFSSTWAVGGSTAAALFALLGWAVCASTMARQAWTPRPGASMKQIGDLLMRPYILPLEIAGLLLTAALIGAVVISMQEGRDAQ
jgi:NADH-quinone oxidoreductase subunit J